MKELDPTTLAEITKAICGTGDLVHPTTLNPKTLGAYLSDMTPEFHTPFPLREQPELGAFLRRSGVEFEVPEEIPDRKDFVLSLLTSINGTSELERLLIRLASPMENRVDSRAFDDRLTYLNDILYPEGLSVEIQGVEPKLMPLAVTTNRPEKETVFDAPPDFGRLVQDEEMASMLEFRWEEAQRCVQAGAYLAAVVMMGSLLEGALLAKLKHPEEANSANSTPFDAKREQTKRFRDWGLSAMIDVAHEKGWIRGDVKAFSHAIRNYRNLVHPAAESAKSERPNRGTCDLSRQAVELAIRDLSDNT